MLQSAVAGYADAMDAVGTYYQDGIGCLKDSTSALHWWKHAVASSSHSGSENNLGVAYAKGEGVEKDPTM
jgi:TPR repeat protein